ncbi:TPA: transglycosylase SLT domain-containing protein [Morganella morganii]|nr:transglycosylase SLT domain-containing protein [Morganella morganii]
MKVVFILFSTLMFPVLSVAQDCYDLAGHDYHIDPDLLRAISFRESSFRTDALNRVSDEKYAVGLMQIHSQNFSELRKYGIQENMLKHDPCMNIYTGAYYLAKFIHLEKDIWRGVGAYNAGREKSLGQERKRQRYADEVYIIYRSIKNSR